MITELLKSILITSFIGSFLTLLITLFRPFTKRLFGYGWHYYIWLTVLLVMILPIRFTSANTDIIAPTHKNTAMHTITDDTSAFDENPQVINVPSAITTQTPQYKSDTIAVFFYNIADTLAIMWLLGILAMLSFSIVGYIRLLRRIHKKSVIISCPEIHKYTKRNITVRICDELSSPFIMGILRPTLILPDVPLSAQQLDNILLQEVTHLKRNDILYKWFVTFTKALHWFNPVVYYISKQINIECEISCDMAVVSNMDTSQTTDYVDTILSLLSSGKAKTLPLTTGMTSKKKILKKRFAVIKSKFTVNKKVIILSIISAVIILLSALCASGFLNGKWIGLYNNNVTEFDTDKRIGNTFNTLIIGTDEQNRADSLMLLKLTDTNIDGFSIPRNALFDGKTISQILSEENGDQKAINVVRNELSVPITYYAKIKIDLVRDLVDIVDGLTVDVPMDMKYDDSVKNLHIDLTKGTAQNLNGEQICGLLQFRRSNDGTGYAKGDLDRIKVGQQVISAFLTQNKIEKLLLNTKNSIDTINKNVVTNYPIKNIIKDKKLLQGKNITFYTIPGKTSVNDGIFDYKIDLEGFNGILNPSVKSNNPPQIMINPVDNSTNTVSSENTLPTEVYLQNTQPQNNNTTNESTPPENTESTIVSGFDSSTRLDFSSISEAEQYLQSGGAVAALDKNFKSGSSYIKDGYSFENDSNETISKIVSNDNGEVYMYFNGNINSLMGVSFKDAETRDEVNSAVILTGNSRIYKFTGLDPTRQYDIELTDKNNSEWDVEGQYIIF